MTAVLDRPLTGSTRVLPTTYHGLMAVEKISVSLDADVAAQARQAAHRAGMSLSAWLSLAAQRAAHASRARRILEGHFEEHGDPDPSEVAEVRAELDAIGFGHPMSPAQERARRRTLAWLDGDVDTEGGE